MKGIYNKKLIILIIAVAILGGFNIVRSAFTEQINYQGKLTTTSSVAVPDGTYNMEFKLWNDATAGVQVWTLATATPGWLSNARINALTYDSYNKLIYAGGDFLENVYKTIIKKPSLYSFPEDLIKK